MQSFTTAPQLDLVDQPSIPDRAPTRRQAVAWASYDGFQSHPGAGLTPVKVNNIFRAAEMGLLRGMMDLFDDIEESDGNLRALHRARIDGVAGKDWLVQPGADDAASMAAAEALEYSIRSDEIDFVEFMEHQLEAPFRGFSASEIDWQVRDDLVVPARFIDVPHRRFIIGRDGDLRLLVAGDSSGVPLAAGKWVVAKRKHANLARAGLLRTATWWSLFKRMAMSDWINFAERFGIPIAIGEYDPTSSDYEPSEKAKAALEAALRDIGKAGAAMLERGTRIYFADGVAMRDGDNAALHPMIVDHCDSEIAKLITGATLTADTGGPGSFALGRVHEGSFFSLKVADAVRFARVFMRDVSVPFCRFNGFAAAGARPPRLMLKLIPELDPKTKAEVAQILVDMGGEVDIAQLRDELGFRKPVRPEDAGKPASSPAPGGGGGDPSDGGEGDPDDDPDDALALRNIAWEDSE